MRALMLVLAATVLAGCEGSVRGNALQFRQAREAYISCANARGADHCTAERDVMNASAIR